MSYQCRACSYAGRKFPQGVCPACGSAHIHKSSMQSSSAERRKPWSVLVLIGLWAYLGFAIYQKLWA